MAQAKAKQINLPFPPRSHLAARQLQIHHASIKPREAKSSPSTNSLFPSYYILSMSIHLPIRILI